MLISGNGLSNVNATICPQAPPFGVNLAYSVCKPAGTLADVVNVLGATNVPADIVPAASVKIPFMVPLKLAPYVNIGIGLLLTVTKSVPLIAFPVNMP
ncbi:hypothetical protein FLACHUCJ7_00025 [Flavobacterium chungangense]|uniref:Uncharacterized protein n=1 Tax=Flavobacterium chungangense TaxID=554283 RepID=A0A6V6YLZ3_9FLAO|nr:hypothetical protein FLACHUCJ7_00025 [Flavobacterium chungangense]